MVYQESIKQATGVSLEVSGISLYDDEYCNLYERLQKLTKVEQDKILGLEQGK